MPQYHKSGIYNRIPILYRIIAFILIIAFLAETIAWAYPDSFADRASQNNKLAAPSFFKDEESIHKAYAKAVEYLIERNGVPTNKLTLETVKYILDKHKKENWLKDNIRYTASKGEVLISIPPGYILRYYDPLFKYEHRYANKKEATEDKISTIPLNEHLYKQLLNQEAKPGPTEVENLKAKALSQKSIAITNPAKQSNLPFYEFGAWTAIYSTFVNRAGWQGLDYIDRLWPVAIGIGIAVAIFWLASKIDWHRLRRQIRRSFRESFMFWGSYKIGISIFLFIACFGSYISINWPKLANYAIEQEIESRGQELAAQVEYAKSLLNEGKSPEEVARIFGATPEEIRAIQSLPPDEIGRLKNLDSGTIAEIVRRKFPQFSAQIPVSAIIDRLGYEDLNSKLKEKGRFTGVVTVTSSGNRRLFDVRGWLERVGKSGSWFGKVTHYVSGVGGRDKYGNVGGAARLTDNGRNIDIGAGVTSSGIPKAIVFNPEVTASGVNGLKLKEVDPITNKVTVEDTGRRPIRPSDIVYYSTFLLFSGIALGLLLIYIELLFGFGFDLSNFTYSLATTYILHIFIYSDIRKKASGNETEIEINPGIGERINGLLLNSFKELLKSRGIKIFEFESPLRAKIGDTDEEESIIAYIQPDETKKKPLAFYYYEKALLSLNPISLLYVLFHEGLETHPRLKHGFIYPAMFFGMMGLFMFVFIPFGLKVLSSIIFMGAGLKFTPREESSKHAGIKFTKWVLLNLIPHSKIEEISQSMNDSVGRKVFIKYFLHQETYEAIAKELHSFPSDVHNILKKYISRPSIEQLILKWRGMINEVLEDLGKEARLFPYEILVFRLHFGLREDGEEYTYEEIIKEAKKISSKNKEIDASKLSHISNVSKIINEIVIPKVLDKLSTELVEITAPPGELNHKGYKTRSESPSKFDKNLYELYGLKVRDEKELDKKLLMMLKGYKKTISAFEKLVRSAINNVERKTPNKDFNIIQKLSKLAPANMKILFERIPKDLTEDFYDKVAGASVVMHLLSNSRYNKRGFTDLRIGLLISISLALIPLVFAFKYENNVPVSPIGIFAFILSSAAVGIGFFIALIIIEHRKELLREKQAKEYVEKEYTLKELKEISLTHKIREPYRQAHLRDNYAHPDDKIKDYEESLNLDIKERVRELLKKFDTVEVLDIGTGYASVLEELSDIEEFKGKIKLYGISMYKRLQERYDLLRDKGIEIEILEAEDLPEEWNSKFHLVISRLSFGAFRDPFLALSEMHRALTPGGEAHIQFLILDKDGFAPSVKEATTEKKIASVNIRKALDELKEKEGFEIYSEGYPISLVRLYKKEDRDLYLPYMFVGYNPESGAKLYKRIAKAATQSRKAPGHSNENGYFLFNDEVLHLKNGIKMPFANLPKEEIKSILVLSSEPALGNNIVQSMGMIELLAKMFPEAIVEAIVPYPEIYSPVKYKNILFSKLELSQERLDYLQNKRYDLAIDLRVEHENAEVVNRIVNISKRTLLHGIKKDSVYIDENGDYYVMGTRGKNINEYNIYEDFYKELGILEPGSNYRLELEVTEEEMGKAKEILSKDFGIEFDINNKPKKPIILINNFSSVIGKETKDKIIANLIVKILGEESTFLQTSYILLNRGSLMEGKEDRTLAIKQVVNEKLKRSQKIVLPYVDIGVLKGILTYTTLVISPDSGIVHLGANLKNGPYNLVFFTETYPEHWLPPDNKTFVFGSIITNDFIKYPRYSSKTEEMDEIFLNRLYDAVKFMYLISNKNGNMIFEHPENLKHWINRLKETDISYAKAGRSQDSFQKLLTDTKKISAEIQQDIVDEKFSEFIYGTKESLFNEVRVWLETEKYEVAKEKLFSSNLWRFHQNLIMWKEGLRKSGNFISDVTVVSPSRMTPEDNDALTKLYLESPKEFKLKFKGRDVVLRLERLDRKNFEILDKWQESVYPFTYDEAELKKRLDSEWERKQEDLKNNKLHSLVITSEFRGEPKVEALIEYKFLPYYHNQVWIFRLETAPWNRKDRKGVDTSATRLAGLGTTLVKYVSEESFKRGGEGIVLVDAYNSEEFYKNTGFQYLTETPPGIQERYSASAIIDKPKVMILLPKPLPGLPNIIALLLEKADSSQGEEKRKWLENVVKVINDELKKQNERIESERGRLSKKGEHNSPILENLLSEKLVLKLKLDYATGELAPIFIRDVFELKEKISGFLRTDEERAVLDLFIEYILKRGPILERTRHILEHCVDAMDMVTLLGEKMGKLENEINDLRFAAFAHDIGKLYSEESVDFFDDPRRLEEFSGEERRKAERFIKEHRARSIEILEKAGVKLKPIVKEMIAEHNSPSFPILFISDLITAWHDTERPYKKSPLTGKREYKKSMEVLDEIETVHYLYLNWYPELAEAFAAARKLADERDPRYESIAYRTYPDKWDGSIAGDAGRVSPRGMAPEANEFTEQLLRYFNEAIALSTAQADVEDIRKATLNITREILPCLHPDDLEALRKVIGEVDEERYDVRSKTIKLKHPITKINDKPISPIDELYVKGIRLNPNEKLLPHIGSGSTVVEKVSDKSGKIHKINPVTSPEGGACLSYVINEYLMHYDLYRDTRFDAERMAFRYPVGWGQIKGVEYNDGPLGYLILGQSSKLVKDKTMNMLDRNAYVERGRCLRKMHDFGYIGPYLHGGNCRVSLTGPTLLWDFADATNIKRKPINELEFVSNIIIDIVYGMTKSLQDVTFIGSVPIQDFAVAFLEGYFGAKELQQGGVSKQINVSTYEELKRLEKSLMMDSGIYKSHGFIIEQLKTNCKKAGIVFLPEIGPEDKIEKPKSEASYFDLADISGVLIKLIENIKDTRRLIALHSLGSFAALLKPLLSPEKHMALIEAIEKLPADKEMVGFSVLNLTASKIKLFRKECQQVKELIMQSKLSDEEIKVILLLLKLYGMGHSIKDTDKIIKEEIGYRTHPDEWDGSISRDSDSVSPSGMAPGEEAISKIRDSEQLSEHTDSTPKQDLPPNLGSIFKIKTEGEKGVIEGFGNERITFEFKAKEDAGVNPKSLIAGFGLTPEANRNEVDSVLLKIIRSSTKEDYRLLRILGFGRKQREKVIGKSFKNVHELLKTEGIGPKTLKNAIEKIRLSIECQAKYKEGFINFIRLALSIGIKDKEEEIQKKLEEIFAGDRGLLKDREFLEKVSNYFAKDRRILISLVNILWTDIRAGPESKEESRPAIDTLLNISKLTEIDIKLGVPEYKLKAIEYLGRLNVKKIIPNLIIHLADYPKKDEFYQTAFQAIVNLAKEGDLRNFYAFIKSNTHPALAKLAIEAVSNARPGRASGMRFLKEALKHPNPDVRSLSEDKLRRMAPEEPFKNIPESLVSVLDMLELRSGGHPLIKAIHELFGWKIDFISEAKNEVDSLTNAEILEQAAEDLKKFSEREENKDIPSRTDNLAEFIKIEIIGEYDIFQLLHGLYAGSLYYHYKTLEIEKKPSLATKNEDALKEEFKGLYTFLKAISITMREIDAAAGDVSKRSTHPASPQMGKLAKVKEAFERDSKKYLKVVDAKDETKVLGEVELTLHDDNQILINTLNKLIEAYPEYKDILNAFLEKLQHSPPEELPEFYFFKDLIRDLFGYASSKDNLIAIHESLITNPIAIFHEIGEYLIKSNILNLRLEKEDKLTIFIRDKNGEKRFSVALSQTTIKFIEKHFYKEEGGVKGWGGIQHYLLRVLQKEIFGKRDRELTHLIKAEQIIELCMQASHNCKLGNLEEASSLLEHAYSLLERSKGTEFVRRGVGYVIGGYNELAKSYINSNACQDAESILERSYAILKEFKDIKSIANQASYIISSYNWLAKLYIDSKNYQKAEAMLTYSYSMLKEFKNAGYTRNQIVYIIGSHNRLTDAYTRLNDYQKAEAALAEAHSLLEEFNDVKAVKDQAGYIARDYFWLAKLYVESKEYQKAKAALNNSFLIFKNYFEVNGIGGEIEYIIAWLETLSGRPEHADFISYAAKEMLDVLYDITNKGGFWTEASDWTERLNRITQPNISQRQPRRERELDITNLIAKAETLAKGAANEISSKLADLESVISYKSIDGKKALVLYADSMLKEDVIIQEDEDKLKPGAIVDLEATIRKASLFDNTTIIVYGRKDSSALLLKDILENLSKKAGRSISIMTLTSVDLPSQTELDERVELDNLIRYLKRSVLKDIDVHNGSLLGVIKGQTKNEGGLEAKAKELKIPVVSFKYEEGIYLFAEALAELLRIKNSESSVKRWLRILEPIKEFSKDIKEAYENYIMMLRELETKA